MPLLAGAIRHAERVALAMDSRAYLALNLAGAAILAVLAAREHQYGFLLLEAVWAVVAAHGLLRQA